MKKGKCVVKSSKIPIIDFKVWKCCSKTMNQDDTKWTISHRVFLALFFTPFLVPRVCVHIRGFCELPVRHLSVDRNWFFTSYPVLYALSASPIKFWHKIKYVLVAFYVVFFYELAFFIFYVREKFEWRNKFNFSA